MARFCQDTGTIAQAKATDMAVNSFIVTFFFFCPQSLGQRSPHISHTLTHQPTLSWRWLCSPKQTRKKPDGGRPACTNPRLFTAGGGLSNTRKISICTHARGWLRASQPGQPRRFQSNFSDYSAPGQRGAAPAHILGARRPGGSALLTRVGLAGAHRGPNEIATHQHRVRPLIRLPWSGPAPSPQRWEETCPSWSTSTSVHPQSAARRGPN